MSYYKTSVLVISILLGLSTSAFCLVTTHEIKVTGVGATYQDALNEALKQAIGQQYGIHIASDEIFKKEFKDEVSHLNDETETSGKHSFSSKGKISLKTQGLIESYEILSHSKNEDGMCEVTAKVKISEYITPGLSPKSRRRMAVMPFRVTPGNYIVDGERISREELSRQFTQKVVNDITQIRRFAVLEREYVEEILNEKKLILSADAPLKELMKIGEALGTDYLLVGTISKANLTHYVRKIQITGQTSDELEATFVVDYRIVVMATRQIKWADSVTMSLNTDEIAAITEKWNKMSVWNAILQEASKGIVQKSTENIYPIRIAGISEGKVILNQGGNSLNKGDMLKVFSLGEKIYDQYTGESLGEVESPIGVIKIVQVMPKMSYAKIVRGNIALMKKDNICRRMPKMATCPIPEPSGCTDVQETESGGILLPGDR